MWCVMCRAICCVEVEGGGRGVFPLPLELAPSAACLQGEHSLLGAKVNQ